MDDRRRQIWGGGAAVVWALALLVPAFPGDTLRTHPWGIWAAFVPLLVVTAQGGSGVGALLFWGAAVGTGTVVYRWLPLLSPLHYAIGFVMVTMMAVAFGALAAQWLGTGDPTVIALGIPSLWVVAEYGLTLGPFGFPGVQLGGLLFGALPLLQVASLTGVSGLSFLVMLWNVGLACWWLRRARWPLGAAAGLTLAALGYGSWQLREPMATERVVRIGLVQYGGGEKRGGDLQKLAALTRLLSTDPSAPRPDLVVWPEEALDEYPAMWEELRAVLGGEGVPLLIGAPHRELVGSAMELYNSMILLDPDHRAVGRYDKVTLVPFWESLPFGSLAAVRGMISPRALRHRYSPGRDVRPLLLPTDREEVPFGTFLCYEGIFPKIPRLLARQGAQFLVNPSADAWSPFPASITQQIAYSIPRAVETGRFLIRVSDLRGTVMISPRGQVLVELPGHRTASTVVTVPLATGLTVYARGGEWFVGGCALAALGTMAAVVILRRRSRARKQYPLIPC